MAEAFTVFEKFGDVCAELDVEDRKELIYAINMYGMFGEEIELPYMLKALFVSLKDDIDNSKEARAQGMKGASKRWGKKSSSKASTEDSTPSDECVTPVYEKSIGGHVGGYVDDAKNSDSQYKPNQANTSQANPKKRFVPPSVDEVRSHCAEKGYTFDPEAFVAFYESKGWKVGRNPMKSWQAACTTWQKRQGERKGESHDEYSNL